MSLYKVLYPILKTEFDIRINDIWENNRFMYEVIDVDLQVVTVLIRPSGLFLYRRSDVTESRIPTRDFIEIAKLQYRDFDANFKSDLTALLSKP